jgi:transcriptional regulator with XRE-family HTH domain
MHELYKETFMNPTRTMQTPLLPVSLYAMSFSERIIALRRERGMTQQGFADATGIHVQQIKRYEADTSQPSADALKKIAVCFGVTTDWLLFEDAERGPSDDLRLQFEAMNQLSTEEKAVAREVLEGLLLKHTARKWSGINTPQPAAKKKTASAPRTGTRG